MFQPPSPSTYHHCSTDNHLTELVIAGWLYPGAIFINLKQEQILLKKKFI